MRPVCVEDADFRAQVRVRAGAVFIDYVEQLPGYFWGYDLLERLLQYLEDGGGSAVFYERDLAAGRPPEMRRR